MNADKERKHVDDKPQEKEFTYPYSRDLDYFRDPHYWVVQDLNRWRKEIRKQMVEDMK